MLESYANNKIEEIIDSFKRNCESKGLKVTDRDIMLLRAGIQYGITLSSFILIESSKLLDGDLSWD